MVWHFAEDKSSPSDTALVSEPPCTGRKTFDKAKRRVGVRCVLLCFIRCFMPILGRESPVVVLPGMALCYRPLVTC